jgi:hypothetical protein
LIEHIRNENNQPFHLQYSKELAEMIGIALGDGGIPKNKVHLRIVLNKSEEPHYTEYVKDLMQRIFYKKPGVYEPKDANAIKLTISKRDIVDELIHKGLQPGDKKVNQVNVPGWIKSNKEYQKACLRGLVDTDGSLYIHKHTKRIRISFKNASYPLINDFKELCESIGIKTSKIRSVKGQNTYDVAIETKKNVVKFLDNVQPRKWKIRAEILGLVLISISNPIKRKKIDFELLEKYPDRRVHYTQDYKEKLKGLCKKYEYDVSKEAIYKKIEEALTYDLKYKNLSYEKKKELNDYAKKIINNLKCSNNLNYV